MLAKIKLCILWVTVPLQKWFQRRGRRETIMTQALVDRMVALIRPGDILTSYEAQRPTNFFIKGFYDHAVIVSSRGTVVEAVGDLYKKDEHGDWILNPDGSLKNFGGVREVPLEEWLYKKDHVAIIRTNLPKGLITAAAMNALPYIGLSYDYYFTRGNKKVYCSELPYECYVAEWTPFLAELPEDEEILPQYYVDMCGKVSYLELVFDTRAVG